ncbi:hypothetical protein [Clostridium sp. UBA2485]|uniref:hypothetical protein n=1 Tax=Clostridium sp. UBA2485 TaxID=1946352 RepID=UPI0025C4ADBA|nr:hypothetical protein [Clostridium sp. UBA2485]
MKSKYDSDILEFIDEFEGITIEQTKKLFFNTKYGYDTARRRLKKLQSEGLIKVGKDYLTQKDVYYIVRKPSSHTVMIMNVYAELYSMGVEIVYFQRGFKVCDKRSDALMIVKYKGIAKMILLEIDINNRTKDDKYQAAFKQGEIQRKYGTFPIVLVAEKERIRKGKNEKIEIGYKLVRTSYTLEGIKQII